VREPRGVIVFLILAFGIAWISWEIPVRLGLAVTSPLFQLAAVPGAFAPAIAAVIVRVFVTREGFADAGLKLPFKRWPYFLFALLLPYMVVAAIVFEAQHLDVARPDFTLLDAIKGLSGRVPPAGRLPFPLFPLVAGQMLVSAVIFTPVLWGEEFGWRGYLQPRLFPNRPTLAAVVTGLIWGVWHYPLILRGYDYGDQPLQGAAVFLVGTVLFSIIFGWLVRRTGSIWSSSLAHSATNVIGGGLTTLLFYSAKSPVWTGYLGILAWPPLLVVSLLIVIFGRERTRPTPVATSG
jgi:membrane protease YdiL (CAAX protease family)